METTQMFTLNESVLSDETIEAVSEQHFRPDSGVHNINSRGDIHINLTNRGAFYLPHDSILTIEGSLVKRDGSRYAATDKISLINNAPLYLFSQIRYMMGGQEIEKIESPGQATSMMGLLTYPSDFGETIGLDQCWVKDNNEKVDDTNTGFKTRRNYLMSTTPTGVFQFHIPLKHIFGFCDDYEKVVSGVDHKLILSRGEDHDAIIRDAEVGEGKIVLSDIIWVVPQVRPVDDIQMETNNFLNSKSIKYPIPYMQRQCHSIAVNSNKNFHWNLGAHSTTETPRFVIVGFQSDKDSNQEKNPSYFDHLDVTSINVEVAGKRYPETQLDIDFSQNKFSGMYKACANFRRKFYSHDHLLTTLNISPLSFKNLYTLFVFDISKQVYDKRQHTSDLVVKSTFRTAPTANTQAFAVVVSDRVINMKGDNGTLRCLDDFERQ